MCTLVDNRLHPLVEDIGIIMENRAVWIKFSDTLGGDIGLVNLYAPNCSTERVQLWHKLVSNLPINCQWHIAGDFNMMDKSSQCGRLLSGGEKFAWESFRSNFQVTDPFKFQGKLRFTWDNQHKDGCRIPGRLDRYYLSESQNPDFSAAVKECAILGANTISDHHPVRLELALTDEGRW